MTTVYICDNTNLTVQTRTITNTQVTHYTIPHKARGTFGDSANPVTLAHSGQVQASRQAMVALPLGDYRSFPRR